MTTDVTKGVAGGAKAGRASRILGGLALAAALALAPAGRAEAQWSTSFGGYGGYGAGMGMTPYDQVLLREQISELNQSQYELNYSNAYRARAEAEMMSYMMALIQEQVWLTRAQTYQLAATAGKQNPEPEPAAQPVRTGKGRRVVPKPARARAAARVAASDRPDGLNAR